MGDNGTSFGPFQLHKGGALPASVPLSQGQAWATSQPGLSYALDRIASVARGLKGRQAVAAIVSRFERPADIPGEIARASQGYGDAPAAPVSAPSPTTTQGARGALSPFLAGILNQNNAVVGLPTINFGSQAVQAGPRQTPVAAQGGSPAGTAAKPRKTGSTIRALASFASPFGLEITSTTGGTHAKGSYHYQGRAVDFGGEASGMANLARTALSHPQDFTEVIYTGPGSSGYSILDGKVVANTELPKTLYDQHTNHVHLAR